MGGRGLPSAGRRLGRAAMSEVFMLWSRLKYAYPPFIRAAAGKCAPDPSPNPACCGRCVPEAGPLCLSAYFSPD